MYFLWHNWSFIDIVDIFSNVFTHSVNTYWSLSDVTETVLSAGILGTEYTNE